MGKLKPVLIIENYSAEYTFKKRWYLPTWVYSMVLTDISVTDINLVKGSKITAPPKPLKKGSE